MHRDRALSGTALLKGLGFALVLWVTACGGGGGSSAPPVGNQTPPPPGPTATPGPGETPDPGECSEEFEGTFAGIQEVIFERQGCTQAVCHGSSAQGGLNLSADVAYENIFEKKALGSQLNLIEPGDEERSYLWLKLAAATKPDIYGSHITGAPMPNGLAPISENDLELVRKWIYAGAPEEETVSGTEELLDACLPPPRPITIEPLDPPAEGEGIQFVLPPWQLEAGSEFEGCYATYYDVTEQTPEEKQNPDGTLFRFKGFEVRQDPQSHHLLLYYSPLNLEPGGVDVTHESFGEWVCRGGPRADQACDPKELGFCGEGVCTSKLVASFACAGYGPPSGRPAEIIGGAPQAQTSFIFHPGVYQQIPLKGVIYWNSHAFNLTADDHTMQGRVNYYFAEPEDQVHQAVRISNFSAIFSPNNPPFTKETFCNDHVFPVGSRVFQLFAHTHRHGEYYWVTNAAGEMIYEATDYSDPTQARYDPPLEFDSPDRAQRTVRYCAIFNNGVKPDGSPDIELVTRASRVPPVAQQFLGKCTPVACVAGQIGAPCDGEDDDAACDSSPGAGDGWCDACNITGGESTENEMFVLFGAQFIDPTVPGAELDVLPYQ
jgi:hypothetical protein